ncbi:hypothetical protein [Catellatospora sichuanensis]|uniref:hypothetical protein n=1 Tax=Catellatospora sichuanensis TaxID=1969805 RepID=UPI001183DD0C|nr:hypothetical protein [Catellatospora sichuanensis]
MKSFNRRRAQRVLGVAGLAAATLLAFGSFAQAEPEAAAVIQACVSKKTGDVRIPELPRGDKGCAKNEQPLTWNVKGPRGPRGPEGPQGPPGSGALLQLFEATGQANLGEGPVTVVSLPLTEGRFAVTASIIAT